MIECKAVSLSCANFQSYYIPTALPCLAASKSFVIRQRTSRRYLSICDAEHKSDRQGDSIMSATAYLEAAVPRDQRPVNELAQLKADLLYSWVRCLTSSKVQSVSTIPALLWNLPFFIRFQIEGYASCKSLTFDSKKKLDTIMCP
jgi:hypothetical protein